MNTLPKTFALSFLLHLFFCCNYHIVYAQCTTYDIKVDVDGKDRLHIKGTQMWLEHFLYQLPTNIFVNGNNWGAWNTSYTIPSVNGETLQLQMKLRDHTQCSSPYCNLIQTPQAANGWETIYEFDDAGPAGRYTYEAKFTFCCNMSPPVTFGNDTSVCKGSQVQLTVSGGMFYKWTKGNDTTGIGTAANLSITADSTTSYSVAVSNTVCSVTKSVSVTVSTFTATVKGNTTICQGDSTTLTASGGTKYTWSNTDTTSSTKIKPVKDTLYKVTVSNGGICHDTTLLINIVLVDTASSITGITKICIGNSTILTANKGTSYSWSTGDTTSFITVSPVYTTTYGVKVHKGQCSGTGSVNVTVNPSPTAKIQYDTAICIGNSTPLKASGGTSYLWSNGATTASIIVHPITTTNYSVVVKNAFSCSDTATISVNVNRLPIINAGNDTTILIGNTAILTATGAENYVWTPAESSCSICSSTTVTPQFSTTYFVVGTDSNGCSNSATVTVTVNTESVLWIPNVFTPNKDGKNEVFNVGYQNITEFKADIFNRWGQHIYKWNDADGGWDGTFKERQCPDGVYVYIIRAKGTDRTVFDKTGFVTLIR